jgi:hypothetical protein
MQGCAGQADLGRDERTDRHWSAVRAVRGAEAEAAQARRLHRCGELALVRSRRDWESLSEGRTGGVQNYPGLCQAVEIGRQGGRIMPADVVPANLCISRED